MSTWWRRNRVAVYVVALLLPITLLGVGGWDWWSANFGRPVVPVSAADGEEIEFGGITWGPAVANVLTPSADANVPPGAKLLEVDIPVDRHGEDTACVIGALKELSGAEREWSADTGDANWDYRKHTFCPTDPASDSYPAGPFRIEVPFILPADATGPFVLDVVLQDELPRVLRLEVVP
jgi:hypothetical protein